MEGTGGAVWTGGPICTGVVRPLEVSLIARGLLPPALGIRCGNGRGPRLTGFSPADGRLFLELIAVGPVGAPDSELVRDDMGVLFGLFVDE
jgi:hypothetical protein